ncbi:MAG: ATP phosphoribosyltransferase [Gemmatimonadetes bacterium]|nr:ATP phosphoribosyltransferase [Gemmatimonadota bacterium]
MIRIALPNKGRLAEETRELLSDAGLPVRSNDRVLTAKLGDDFQALFVRAQDIPEFVADGAADAGVTGWDLVAESGRELESLLDLSFGACRLVVAVREESTVTSVSELAAGTRVATVFPGITRRFFAERGIPVELVPMSGAVEVAPHLGIADVVVDITSTGSTLKTNGLREVETVLRSTAHVVARAGRSEPSPQLDELVAALESVLRARGKRYLMANVPRRALDQVREVVPGLNGPTVIDIMDGGVFVAVHAVVPAAAIYKTIAALKALGAEGILVTRIERLMP